MNTKTAKHELHRTFVNAALSEIVHGGASNPYYADARTRLIVGYFESNTKGEHVAHIGVGRSIDYAGTQLAAPLISTHIASSPVFTDTNDVHSWLAAAERWAVEHYVSSVPATPPAVEFPVEKSGHSYCSSCDSFDTLHVELQAYGNLTTCTTEGCDFSSWYDIGD